MKYAISRNANGKNTMKMKTTLMALIFGTSILAANANMDYNKNDAGDRDHAPVWKDHQFPPPQGNDPHGDGKIVTYSAVPETKEIVVAAMLLLPLGASAIRGLRRNKKCADQLA
jgi:hypothetical protein